MSFCETVDTNKYSSAFSFHPNKQELTLTSLHLMNLNRWSRENRAGSKQSHEGLLEQNSWSTCCARVIPDLFSYLSTCFSFNTLKFPQVIRDLKCLIKFCIVPLWEAGALISSFRFAVLLPMIAGYPEPQVNWALSPCSASAVYSEQLQDSYSSSL